MKTLSTVRRKLERSLKREGFRRTLRLCALNLWQGTRAARRPPADDRGAEFDRRFGTNTTGLVELGELAIESPHDAYGFRYQATPPDVFASMLAALPIDYRDFVFVDLGAGKGRTLLLASELPFKRVVGVEFSPELAAVAEANIHNYRRSSRRCADVSVRCEDAVGYRLPEENIVLYLYNPFHAVVMNAVVRSLHGSLEAHPRKAFVIYYEPALSGLWTADPLFRAVKFTDSYHIYESVTEGPVSNDALCRDGGRDVSTGVG